MTPVEALQILRGQSPYPYGRRPITSAVETLVDALGHQRACRVVGSVVRRLAAEVPLGDDAGEIRRLIEAGELGAAHGRLWQYEGRRPSATVAGVSLLMTCVSALQQAVEDDRSTWRRMMLVDALVFGATALAKVELARLRPDLYESLDQMSLDEAWSASLSHAGSPYEEAFNAWATMSELDAVRDRYWSMVAAELSSAMG